MKKIIATAVLLLSVYGAHAQQYITRTGRITFFSSTPVENIEAINNEASCALDAATGELAFQVPIRSFKFEKALMQEHFNENYMESDKFPKAAFRGKVTDISGVNFGKDGVYQVHAAGSLTIHGVTREVSTPGTITVKGNTAVATAKFRVRPADFDIKIPGVVAGKIAKEIEVTVNSVLSKKIKLQ